RIQASGGLSEADIQRMVKEAEEHAADDKQKRELAEARNQGEARIHQPEKTLKDLGDKAPAGEKSAAETAITALREKLTGE
ncbi:Hsp70 family protein, partial [Acinetobacter baumannii]